MNLYLVVSEPLTSSEGYYGPSELYCFAELVIARNRSQAKYLAWKADKDSFRAWDFIGEMPKFQIRLKKKGIEGLARIVTYDKEYQQDDDLWEL